MSVLDAMAQVVGLDAVAAERVESAFDLLSQAGISVEAVQPRDSNCSASVWPHIDADCLATAGGAPAMPARVVAISY